MVVDIGIKLTGYRTWKKPSEQDNVTRIEELKPDLRDLVVHRRLTQRRNFLETTRKSSRTSNGSTE